MRKGLWIGLILTVVIGALGPEAVARRPRVRESKSVNAFWHSKERISEGKFRRTTWYVGVFQTGDRIWSDLYESVDRCRKRDGGRVRCRQETYRIGVIDDLEGQTFTMDTDSLTTARLDARYPLQAYDSDYDKVGKPVSTRIVADFTGTGRLRESEQTSVRRKGCKKVRTIYEEASRRASATGRVEGIDLSATPDAYMSTSTVTRHRYGC
jgi:hypothetical protein